MSFYSSDSHGDAYRRTTAFRSRRDLRRGPREWVQSDFGSSGNLLRFPQAEPFSGAKDRLMTHLLEKKEDEAFKSELKHKEALQKIAWDTQEKTYDIAKKRAEEAARKQQRREAGAGIGSIAGGLVGSLFGPAGTAIGSRIGGGLGGLFG